MALGLAGGEVGEQLPEPEVLSVAEVQLLRRQRPRRQPPEHCHPGGGSLCHCGGCGSSHGKLPKKHRAMPEICQA